MPRQSILLLAFFLGGSLSLPAGATSCRSVSLEDEFARSTQVYAATLVLAEFDAWKPPADFDQERDTWQPDRYRFVLRVDTVYKGDVPARVEKVIQTDIVVVGESGIRLADLPVKTRLLVFEPHWDSACSRTSVIDRHVEREIMTPLMRLAAARAEVDPPGR